MHAQRFLACANFIIKQCFYFGQLFCAKIGKSLLLVRKLEFSTVWDCFILFVISKLFLKLHTQTFACKKILACTNFIKKNIFIPCSRFCAKIGERLLLVQKIENFYTLVLFHTFCCKSVIFEATDPIFLLNINKKLCDIRKYDTKNKTRCSNGY